MNDFATMMAYHDVKMGLLAEKYIGKQEMARGLAISDVQSRKEWYINRIKELMFQAGRCRERLRRCKLDSATWKRHETVEQECKLLADNLAIDLMQL